MSIIPFLPVIDKALEKLLDLIPDPNARQRAKEQFLKEAAQAAAAQAQQQSDINRVEASHANIFVAGWRPFIGWICGFALLYHYLAQPFLVFLMASLGHTFPLPAFDMDTLSAILFGMLGLGGYRTIEIIQGAAQSPKGKQ